MRNYNENCLDLYFWGDGNKSRAEVRALYILENITPIQILHKCQPIRCGSYVSFEWLLDINGE